MLVANETCCRWLELPWLFFWTLYYSQVAPTNSCSVKAQFILAFIKEASKSYQSHKNTPEPRKHKKGISIYTNKLRWSYSSVSTITGFFVGLVLLMPAALRILLTEVAESCSP